MAYNYKGYLSQYQDEINNTKKKKDDLYTQISNFDSTYDHTKDAGWVAANNQLQSDAKIAASNAYGRLSNRIGATSTAQQTASDSVYANALKNSQNLIPTYKDMALNKLNNQYSLLQNQYSNLLSQDQQAYNRWSDENNFNYQKYLNDENARIESEKAKAAQITAEAEAKAKGLEAQYKLAQLNAENGTNYVMDSNSGKIYNAKKATSFSKAIWDEKMFNNSANMKKKYGSYNDYVKNMIMLGYQRGNLSADDVNYLKTYYNF